MLITSCTEPKFGSTNLAPNCLEAVLKAVEADLKPVTLATCYYMLHFIMFMH